MASTHLKNIRQIGSISVLGSSQQFPSSKNKKSAVLRGHHECHTGVAVETTGARLEDCDLTSEGGPVIIKSPDWRKKGDEILASYLENMYHVILQGSLLTNQVFHRMSPWVFFLVVPTCGPTKKKKTLRMGIWQLVLLRTVDGITTAGCWEQFPPNKGTRFCFCKHTQKTSHPAKMPCENEPFLVRDVEKDYPSN